MEAAVKVSIKTTRLESQRDNQSQQTAVIDGQRGSCPLLKMVKTNLCRMGKNKKKPPKKTHTQSQPLKLIYWRWLTCFEIITFIFVHAKKNALLEFLSPIVFHNRATNQLILMLNALMCLLHYSNLTHPTNTQKTNAIYCNLSLSIIGLSIFCLKFVMYFYFFCYLAMCPAPYSQTHPRKRCQISCLNQHDLHENGVSFLHIFYIFLYNKKYFIFFIYMCFYFSHFFSLAWQWCVIFTYTLYIFYIFIKKIICIFLFTCVFNLRCCNTVL